MVLSMFREKKSFASVLMVAVSGLLDNGWVLCLSLSAKVLFWRCY